MRRKKSGVEWAARMVAVFLSLVMGLAGTTWAEGEMDTGLAGPTIEICPGDPPNKTNLLFPFVTNQAGFDTGIVISNTSMDPFSTQLNHGTCTIYYYGQMASGGSPPPPQTTWDIAAGQLMSFALSQGGVPGATTNAAGFQGYIIARCNFPFAHGFAFISDIGATHLATSYLAPQICSNRGASGACIYYLSTTGVTIAGGGASGTVSVTAGSSCPWTASTNSGSWDWIGISSGASGSGNGTVTFVVSANNTGHSRTGTMTIAGQTFTVAQEACSYSLSSSSSSIGKGGGTGSVSVSTSGGCSWSASATSGSWDWIGISSGWSGTGNATVSYFVLPNNTGSARTGTLMIGGQTFTVTQAGL